MKSASNPESFQEKWGRTLRKEDEYEKALLKRVSPEQREEYLQIMSEWRAILSGLSNEEDQGKTFRMLVNGELKTVEDVQRHMSDNFNRLSQNEKNLLLNSLRMKQWKKDNADFL